MEASACNGAPSGGRATATTGSAGAARGPEARGASRRPFGAEDATSGADLLPSAGMIGAGAGANDRSGGATGCTATAACGTDAAGAGDARPAGASIGAASDFRGWAGKSGPSPPACCDWPPPSETAGTRGADTAICRASCAAPCPGRAADPTFVARVVDPTPSSPDPGTRAGDCGSVARACAVTATAACAADPRFGVATRAGRDASGASAARGSRGRADVTDASGVSGVSGAPGAVPPASIAAARPSGTAVPRGEAIATDRTSGAPPCPGRATGPLSCGRSPEPAPSPPCSGKRAGACMAVVDGGACAWCDAGVGVAMWRAVASANVASCGGAVPTRCAASTCGITPNDGIASLSPGAATIAVSASSAPSAP